jgi:hypothetical protein
MGIQAGTSVNVIRVPAARMLAAGPRPDTSMDMGSEVTVIFTSDKGTRAALKAAIQLARAADKSMLLVVPEMVAFSLAYDSPPIPANHLVQQLWPSISALNVSIRVQVVLCNDEMGALQRMLKSPSLIYLGGSASMWWPTKEHRLARSLRQYGHEVIFVNAD